MYKFIYEYNIKNLYKYSNNYVLSSGFFTINIPIAPIYANIAKNINGKLYVPVFSKIYAVKIGETSMLRLFGNIDIPIIDPKALRPKYSPLIAVNKGTLPPTAIPQKIANKNAAGILKLESLGALFPIINIVKDMPCNR